MEVQRRERTTNKKNMMRIKQFEKQVSLLNRCRFTPMVKRCSFTVVMGVGSTRGLVEYALTSVIGVDVDVDVDNDIDLNVLYE